MAQRYSEETKAAVMAALLAGQGVEQVAAEYNIPASTIRTWKSRRNITVSPEVETQIGELLLAYLDSNLRTLTAQAEHFRDKAWLKLQSADQLAVLHGVMADKSIRLLEAMTRNNASPD